jgi:uroporphyrinogen-III synthase
MPTPSCTPLLVIARSASQLPHTLAQVQAAGFTAVRLPISTITTVPCSCPAGATALVLTSANALLNPSVRQSNHLPIVAVGPATAAQAVRLGFKVIHTGNRNAAGLAAEMIASNLPPHTLWHPRAANAGTGWYAQIHTAGHTVIGTPAYTTTYIQNLPTNHLSLLREQPWVLVFSPAGARALSKLYGLHQLPEPAGVVAISPAVAKAWGQGYGHVRVAASPNLPAMLRCVP